MTIASGCAALNEVYATAVDAMAQSMAAGGKQDMRAIMSVVTQRHSTQTRNEFSLLQIQVLSILPQLETLDEQPVATEEVAAARRLYPDVPAAPRSPVPVGRLSTGYGVRSFDSPESEAPCFASPGHAACSFVAVAVAFAGRRHSQANLYRPSCEAAMSSSIAGQAAHTCTRTRKLITRGALPQAMQMKTSRKAASSGSVLSRRCLMVSA